MSERTCTATRRDGTPCALPATGSGAYCFAHDPGSAGARAKGGRQSSTAARMVRHLPPELRELVARLSGWLGDVEAGTLKPQQATALAALCGRLLDLARLAHELGQSAELEQRLAELEQRLAEQPAARGARW